MEEDKEMGDVRKENLERSENEIYKEDRTPHDEPEHQHHKDHFFRDKEDANPLTVKKVRPKRDLRSMNYAFGEPQGDEAAKEAQHWLDNLSLAEQEEKNNPSAKLFPHGLKYRSGSANLSPQMLERLQKCQENQEPEDPPEKRIMSAEKNSSPDIHAVVHEDDVLQPQYAWKAPGARRSAVGNSSSSVYAVLHPTSDTGNRSPGRKKPTRRRNYLRDHIAAIAEMSYLTHAYKEEERQEEAKRVGSIKYWGGGNRKSPKKSPKRQQRQTNYVAKNKESVTQQSASVRAYKGEPAMPDVLSPHKENIGRVPHYLRRRKSELREQADHRALAEAAKSFPPGRRLMSEVNRRHILQSLENKQKELLHTLKSFPLIMDTPRLMRLRSITEKQLRNIEASHRYYDNPKVFTSCLDVNCPTCSPGASLGSHFPHELHPNCQNDELWDHVASAAGIRGSPRHDKSLFNDFNRRYSGWPPASTGKRRTQDGEVYTSPSKRQITTSHTSFHHKFSTSVPAISRSFQSSATSTCKVCSLKV